jgi:hypothetical protein
VPLSRSVWAKIVAGAIAQKTTSRIDGSEFRHIVHVSRI